MRTAPPLLLSCLILVGIGCVRDPRTGHGLRLPDGDVERGQVAFQEIGCQECHRVFGEPNSDADRLGVVVTLGGEVARIKTYGELVTAIINPSHEISRRYPREQVADGDVSKMENFNEEMTVAQLIDLTAFLQSKYRLREVMPSLPDDDI